MWKIQWKVEMASVGDISFKGAYPGVNNINPREWAEFFHDEKILKTQMLKEAPKAIQGFHKMNQRLNLFYHFPDFF